MHLKGRAAPNERGGRRRSPVPSEIWIYARAAPAAMRGAPEALLGPADYLYVRLDVRAGRFFGSSLSLSLLECVLLARGRSRHCCVASRAFVPARARCVLVDV